MDIKDFIKTGQEIVKTGQEFIDDTVKSISEKIAESDLQTVVLEKSSQFVKDTSEIVGETVKKTLEYAEEKRMIPGSKEKYIQELEAKIEIKEAEIKRLKKLLKLESWRKRK